MSCSLAALTAIPGAAAIDPNYSPVAHGIDLVCNAYRPAAKPADLVYLRRTVEADGTVGPWQKSPDDLDSMLAAPNAPPAIAFATVVSAHGAIVTANVVTAATASLVRETRAWCFIGGKLSRTTVDIVDTGTELEWRRSRYFGDDLEKPVMDWIAENGQNGKLTVPLKDAPTDRLTIETYGTPNQLPFYDAYRAATAAARKKP